MLHLVQPDEIKAVIGRNVAHFRARHDWSQAELAERWGKALGRRIDPTTVTRLERGKRPIAVDELIVLADVFGLPWWEDLVRPPTHIAIAAHLRRMDLELDDDFRRVQLAAVSYLRRQVLAKRQIRDTGDLEVTGLRNIAAWIETPPEEAVVKARLELEGSLDSDERDQVARDRARHIIDELRKQDASLVSPLDVTVPIDGVGVTVTVGAGSDELVMHMPGEQTLDVTRAEDAG
jgi:transcriptional regulator with XRE-family HTH domain